MKNLSEKMINSPIFGLALTKIYQDGKLYKADIVTVLEEMSNIVQTGASQKALREYCDNYSNEDTKTIINEIIGKIKQKRYRGLQNKNEKSE